MDDNEESEDLLHVAIADSVHYLILLIFLTCLLIIIFCCFALCCIDDKELKKTNVKGFKLVRYDKLFEKQAESFIKQTTISKKINKEVDVEKNQHNVEPTQTTEPTESTETTEPTELSESANVKYIYYQFNTVDDDDGYGVEKNNKSNHFNNLNEFVNICIKAFDPKQYKILLQIESPGGYAYKYELAHSRLMRLREKGFDITGLVDIMCCSGGYMLACCCNRIIANKYAQIGSIGVIAQTYNIFKLIDKLGIEEKVFTTGRYKNGFPNGSEYTEDDVKIMNESIDETFKIFRDIVISSRKLYITNPIQTIDPLIIQVENMCINDKTIDIQSMDQPLMDKQLMDQPLMNKQLMDQPLMDQPLMDKQLMDQPLMDQPLMDKQLMDQPLIDQKLIDQIFSAKVWYGKEAIEMKLVDELGLSDDVINKIIKDGHIVYCVKKDKEKDKSNNFKQMFDLFAMSRSIISNSYDNPFLKKQF